MLITSWLRLLTRRIAFLNRLVRRERGKRVRYTQSAGRGTAAAPLSFERLEKRTLLAALTVNSALDNTTSDAFLTLREAAAVVNDGDVSDGVAGLGGRVLTAGELAQIGGKNPLGTNDSIDFDSSLDGTPILLDGATLGEIAIAADVEIHGNGQSDTIIDAQSFSRIFDITSKVGDVTITGVTLQNGFVFNETGGAIRTLQSGTLSISDNLLTGNSALGDDGRGGAIGVDSYGSGGVILDITDTTLTGNRAGEYGGAIYSFFSTLNISGSTLSDNHATGDDPDAGGGAISANASAVTITGSTLSGNTGLKRGGAIQATLYSGSLTIEESTLSGNTAQFGGAVYAKNGNVAVSGSMLLDNHALAGSGGALFQYEGSLEVSGSEFSGNSAAGGGGAIYSRSVATTTIDISGSTFRNNEALDGFGGAVRFRGSGEVTISDSLFDDNSADDGFGGAASVSNDVTVLRSTFLNNTATHPGAEGGALHAVSDVTVVDSLFSGNSVIGDDAHGGAIYSEGSEVTLINSTLSGNSANGVNARGGGVYAEVADVLAINSTIVDNHANGMNAEGGGIFTGDAITLHNSIVSGNTDSGPNPEFYSYYVTVLNSLVSENTGTGLAEDQTGASGNFIGTALNPIDPLLGPLQNNGGPTFTHALLLGSDAIDSGENALAVDSTNGNAPLVSDQRVTPFNRVFGVSVDMGAYELQGIDFGDAPDSYGTTLGADGARHVAVGPTLGATRDAEPDGQPTPDATGDGADEDGGVLTGPLVLGRTTIIELTASAPGFVNAWTDTNFDGDFDPEEQFLFNHAVTAGVNSISIFLPDDALPASALPQDVFGRYRLTSAPVETPSPIGLLPDGEVEDYQATIYHPTFVLWLGTLTSTGGDGDDVYILDLATRTLSVNGVVNAIPGSVSTFAFDAGGGNDTLIIEGAHGTEQVRLLPGRAVLEASSVGLTGAAGSFETIVYNGQGNGDSAILVDSAGNDTFVSGPTTSRMQGSGFLNVVNGVRDITGVSNRGGSDVTRMFDGDGDQTFTARPTSAAMTKVGLSLQAIGFGEVTGTASDGNDRAVFIGSSGAETLIARPMTASFVTAAGVSNAVGFDRVTGRGEGGSNTARLFGSADVDSLRADPTSTIMTGPGFEFFLESFETVIADLLGGSDFVELTGSDGDDLFAATPNFAQIAGAGIDLQASNVERIIGLALTGASDTAILTDSAGDDTFSGVGNFGDLRGAGFFERVTDFDTVRIRGVNGGLNRVLTAPPLAYNLVQQGDWV